MATITSKTVLSSWKQAYKTKHHASYAPVFSEAHDMKQIADAIKMFGNYAVMVALLHAVEEDCSSVKEAIEEIDSYVLPNDDAKIHYCISKYGDVDHQEIFDEYRRLSGSWIIDAEKAARIEEHKKRLEEWADVLEG